MPTKEEVDISDKEAQSTFSNKESDMAKRDILYNTSEVKNLFAQYPLLGSCPDISKYMEKARNAVFFALKHSDGKLALQNRKGLLLGIIHSAKNRDVEEEKGFWEYIAKQFGLNYSTKIL